MSKREVMPVSAHVEAGDYGRDYARLTVGGLEVTVYQSQVRPGGITVEIDGDDDVIAVTVVNVNDWQVHPAEEE